MAKLERHPRYEEQGTGAPREGDVNPGLKIETWGTHVVARQRRAEGCGGAGYDRDADCDRANG